MPSSRVPKTCNIFETVLAKKALFHIFGTIKHLKKNIIIIFFVVAISANISRHNFIKLNSDHTKEFTFTKLIEDVREGVNKNK